MVVNWALFWNREIDLCVQSFFQGYIDARANHIRKDIFRIEDFYGNSNVVLRKFSWELLNITWWWE